MQTTSAAAADVKKTSVQFSHPTSGVRQLFCTLGGGAAGDTVTRYWGQ